MKLSFRNKIHLSLFLTFAFSIVIFLSYSLGKVVESQKSPVFIFAGLVLIALAAILFLVNLVFIKDSTERKSMEESLRQQEQLLSNILESMNEGVLVLDHELRCRIFNKSSEEMSKTSREAVFGKTPWEIFPHIAGSDVEKCMRNALQGAQMENLEIPVTMPDGSIEWHRDSFSPLIDKNDEIIGVVGVVSDITKQKLIEQSLRESEARFKVLHNASFGGIAIHDKGVILECNQGLSDMFGYPPEELIGMEGLLLIAEQSRPMVKEKIRTGYQKPYEAIGLPKNGDEFPVQLEGRHIPYKGKDAGSVEFRDLTEQKKIEQEKKSIHGQLIQAQKMESIGRLAGGIAHDLNNLLVPILGYAEMLLGNESEETSRRKRLQAILNAGLGARNLVGQLLAFSRKQSLKPQLVDIDRILSDFEPLLRRTIREDITITLLSSPGKKCIMADRTQFEQIIMNLSVNAADAMADGGVLTIETDCVRLDEAYVSKYSDIVAGPCVFMSLKDTGKGMDKETCDRVFEPFFSTKGAEKGTGLGLATVYGIVKQHKGNIEVCSEVGKGTIFKIYFPQVLGEEVRPEAKNASTSELCGRETNLLAEDNDGVRNLATEILSQNGYTVVAAKDGKEALEMCASLDDSVDLLVSDVIMPGMNGRELFVSLQGLDPDIRVLYISGYQDDTIAHHGILDKEAQYIQKPFQSNDFLMKIRQVLAGNQEAS